MWRVSPDLFDSWVDVWVDGDPGWLAIGIDSAIDIAAAVSEYARPGCWNDLDMLVVGLGGKGQIEGNGMTATEYRTHMSIWAIAASPLMIGCDIRSLDEATRTLLTNDEVIAINQDALGIAGRRVSREGATEVWRKPLADGSAAVALVNRGSSVTDIECRAAAIGFLDTRKTMRNVWEQRDEGEFADAISYTVQPHETVLLRVRPV